MWKLAYLAKIAGQMPPKGVSGPFFEKALA